MGNRKKGNGSLDQGKRKQGQKRSVSLERNVHTREEKQRILIVCEGLNTEPDYFDHFKKQFRLVATDIITIGGAGETIGVIERANKERQRADFDQIWVVFDKDDFPAAHFDKAILLAESMEFGVAISNQAFEYWLLLHFEDHQCGPMHRNKYAEKLNFHLKPFKMNYDHRSKHISEKLFELMLQVDTTTGQARIKMAIQRAKRCWKEHEEELSPAKKESSTTVFRLVEVLLQLS
jgi:RloB-like protein